MQTKICKFSVFCFIYDIDSSNYQDENIFPKIKPSHQVAICAKGYNQNHAFNAWYAPALQGHITGRA